jgi:hypothetical protein
MGNRAESRFWQISELEPHKPASVMKRGIVKMGDVVAGYFEISRLSFREGNCFVAKQLA